MFFGSDIDQGQRTPAYFPTTLWGTTLKQYIQQLFALAEVFPTTLFYGGFFTSLLIEHCCITFHCIM